MNIDKYTHSRIIERDLIERGHYLDDLYYITMLAVRQFEELYETICAKQKQLCADCKHHECDECFEADELEDIMTDINRAIADLGDLVERVEFKQ